MTETLLLLNGQTVILTSDEAESLVQNGAAAIGNINNHEDTPLQESDSRDIFLPIVTTGCHLTQPSSVHVSSAINSQSLHSNCVEVKVNGKELPGFVLDNHGTNASPIENRVVNEELENCDNSNGTTVAEFFQLENNVSGKILPKSTSSKGKNVEEERYASEACSISSSNGLLSTQLDHSSALSDLDDIHNIKLPIVSTDVHNLEDDGGESSVATKESPESSQRIVAIIHGEDGSSQSIEIPVEGETFQLSLPQLVSEEMFESQLSKPKEKCDSSLPEQTVTNDDTCTSQILKLDCNNETLQNDLANGTSLFIGDSGEKIILNIANEEETLNKNSGSFEPIIIIPEYGTDENISALQIRSTDIDNSTSVLKKENTVSKELPLGTSVQDIQFPEPPSEKHPEVKSLLFPESNQNAHDKLSKVLKMQKQSGNEILTQVNAPEWKKITPKVRSVPKIPGSKYLRNIAKRTKFQNLSSLLEAKPNECDSLLLNKNGSFQPAVTKGAVSLLSLPKDSDTRLMKDSSSTNTPLKRNESEGSSSTLPMPSSKWSSSFVESSANVSPKSLISNSRVFSIKITTGLSSKISPSTENFIPDPSILCEDNDGPEEKSAPLTSIVYFSEDDEVPQILQLPSGDYTKPLGSKENPIQLVQQGTTFQALQPVHKEQLEQITSLLKQRRLSVPLKAHHDEIYDPKTNMKIVYKVVLPEHLQEELEESDEGNECESTVVLPKKRKRGRRPNKWKMTKIESTSELEEIKVDVLDPEEEEKKLPVSRTRSGRISRPPQHFRHLLHSNIKDFTDSQKLQEEGEKPPEQVFYSLQNGEKRKGISKTLRERYTCGTCHKVLVGRLEIHYKKFPNHRRETPNELDRSSQSYSTMRSLSDTPKMDTKDDDSGKPVLSPTPGTQASETNGEPSLPLETSASLLGGQRTAEQLSNSTGSQDTQDLKLEQEEELKSRSTPQSSRGRRGKARGRRHGRGRWTRPISSSLPQPVESTSKDSFLSPPPPSIPTSIPPSPSLAPAQPPSAVPLAPPPPSIPLDQILNDYSTKDIINAVGKKFSESLTPWQFLCMVADQKSVGSVLLQWQERLDTLQSLLKHCKDDLSKSLDLASDLKLGKGFCGDCSKKKKANESQEKKPKEKSESQEIILCFEDLLKDAVSPVKPEEMDHVQVCDNIACAMGMSVGCYTLKTQGTLLPTSISSILDSCSRPPDINKIQQLSTPTMPPVSESCLLDSMMKSSKEESSLCRGEEDPKYTVRSEEMDASSAKVELTDNEKALLSISKPDYETVPKVSECLSFSSSEYLGKVGECMDVTNGPIIPISTSGLSLPPFTASSESIVNHNPSPQSSGLASSSMLPTCDVATMKTSLSSSTIGLLLNNEAMVNSTTSTMSASTPCVTPAPAISSATPSAPLEVPHFSTSDNIPHNTISSGCMPMTNVDNSLMNMSSLPQVNSMQQIPIGDLDITAEDLPRLLREGMGIVVGSGGDGTGECDAPKLLDTSGDTADLSEMLFKLQEATVGISQSQDPSVYSGQIIPSSSVQQMSGQLMASQSISTQSVTSLTPQAYSDIEQPMNALLNANTGGKDINRSEPSVPLLTFTGALSRNSDFCSVSSSISQQQPINHIGDMKGHQDLMGPTANDPCDHLEKTEESGLSVDRDTMNLSFPVTSLSSSDLEDILKR